MDVALVKFPITYRHPVLPQKYGESSPLRSERDSDAIQRSHIKNRDLQQQVEGLSRTLRSVMDSMRRLRIPTSPAEDDSAPNPSDWFRGQWTDTMVVLKQQAVAFVPDGGHAGIYVCIADAPVGWLPSGGSPYYYKFPLTPQGVWG